MKKKTILVSMGLVLFFGLQQARATIIFNDGQTHNINYLVNDEINIDYDASGMKTTINWLEGANSSYKTNAYEDSKVNVLGGSIGRVLAFDRSCIKIEGGLITGGVGSYGSSQVDVSDGTIVGGHLEAFDNGEIYFSGGEISSEFQGLGE